MSIGNITNRIITSGMGTRKTFDPKNVSGIIADWDVDDVVDSSGASSLPDRSGNGNDVAQSTAGARLAVVHGDADFGGHKSLQGATGDYLRRDTFTGGLLNQPNTRYAVIQTSSNVTTTQHIMGSVVSTNRNDLAIEAEQVTLYAGTGLYSPAIVTANTLAIIKCIVNGATSKIEYYRFDGYMSSTTGNTGSHTQDGITLMARYTDTSPFLGKATRFLLYSGIVSDDDNTKIVNYLFDRYKYIAPEPEPESEELKIFIAGSSIINGRIDDDNHFAEAPGRSLGLSALRTDSEVVNTAEDGRAIAEMITYYNSEILPYKDPSKRNIIIAYEFNNSLWGGGIGDPPVPNGISPAEAMEEAEDYAAMVKADGFEILWCTLLPIDYPSEQVLFDEVNILLRASTAFDGLIECDTMVAFENPGWPHNENYQDDGHLNDVGLIKLTNFINDYLNAYLGQESYPFEMPPRLAGGWSDFKTMLVETDGTQALGTVGNFEITGRDTGSKIVFFDVDTGNNTTAEAYYWDGYNIIDSNGSTTNGSSIAYGTDPFNPNLAAIKPFEYLDGVLPGDIGDARVRAFWHDFGKLAGGYPDWYLFKRGQAHNDFKLAFEGGRNAKEPMLIGGYGPKSDGRAIMNPTVSGEYVNPFRLARNGQSPIYCHMVMTGLDIVGGFAGVGTNEIESVNPDGYDSSAIIEDCDFSKGAPQQALRVLFPPKRTVIRRCTFGYCWNDDDHNQAYYTEGPETWTTFEDVIFYKNGYKQDPRLNADPERDVFSRNIYEGGGALMGHQHRNIISADGASGSPQLRFGGLLEKSYIYEGYFFSSTDSNSTNNPWTTIQEGTSTIIRNNVQQMFDYPNPVDPDPDGYSSTLAQDGGGYELKASSFGAIIEGNIFSGAMQLRELGGPASQYGFTIGPWANTYPDGYEHYMKDCVIRNNITYKTNRGFQLQDTWTGVQNVEISDNIFVSTSASNVSGSGPSSSDQLVVKDNKFYVTNGLPSEDWVGTGNTTLSADGYSAEGWLDPNRTLKGYVTDVLNLTLLDWDDDPYLDPVQRENRKGLGQIYDPTGLKTFMAVAMRMRNGGADTIPSSGKPDMTADYPWDDRFTGRAIVNYIRAGFNLDPV